jgi:hypothetical protein
VGRETVSLKTGMGYLTRDHTCCVDDCWWDALVAEARMVYGVSGIRMGIYLKLDLDMAGVGWFCGLVLWCDGVALGSS